MSQAYQTESKRTISVVGVYLCCRGVKKEVVVAKHPEYFVIF